jgi:hypothetical protein
MPSIAGRSSVRQSSRRQAVHTKTRRRKRTEREKAQEPVRNFNKQQARNFQKKTNNMLQIRTLQPKEQLVSIQYKTFLVFDDMGYANTTGLGATGTIIRINLNNPTYGNAGNIVDVLNLGSNWTNPVFTRTNSTELNLKDKLNEYFDVYQKGVVISSNSQVRVKSRPNQKELGQYFDNEPAQGAQGDAYPYDENHMPYLKVNDGYLDGDSYVWSIKQRTQGQLIDLSTQKTPDFHELQNDIPGMKMKQLTAFKNGTTSRAIQNSCRFTNKYFGIKDWRDNIASVQFMPGMAADTPPANINDLKRAYHYVGVCNTSSPQILHRPQRVVAEIVVNYECLFLNRKNDVDGEDNPVPQVPHAPHSEL